MGKKLREIGLAAASWDDLGGTAGKGEKQQKADELPLHLKAQVVGSVKWQELDKLDISAETRAKSDAARLWRTNSHLYEKIRDNLHLIERKVNAKMRTDDAKLNAQCKKITTATGSTRAWCNAMTRTEWEKSRRRGLIEPLINDVIRALNAKAIRDAKRPLAPTELPFDVSVAYTEKESIRQAVLEHETAATADMSSWFDQLGIQKISDLFGLVDEDDNEYEAQVMTKGFMSSCNVAHSTLEVLAPHPPVGFHAKFVDNIGFFGSRTESSGQMKEFKERAHKCGAIVNDENNEPRTEYDFLGETYNHVRKTRALTMKTVEKLVRIAALLKPQKPGETALKMTCRRAMAIIGTLFYAAEVLDINLTQFVTALKEHARLAAEAGALASWDHKVVISAQAAEELRRWQQISAANEPVHVTRGRRSEHNTEAPTTTIYTDASAWGWGAIIVSGSTVRHFSQPWAQADHDEATATGGYLQSSVHAEPMAMRRALCCTPIRPGTHIDVHTDHQGLVYAAGQRYSYVDSYNQAIALLNDLQQVCSVAVHFIQGIANPADALSRGVAPVLPVTRVGCACG